MYRNGDKGEDKPQSADSKFARRRVSVTGTNATSSAQAVAQNILTSGCYVSQTVCNPKQPATPLELVAFIKPLSHTSIVKMMILPLLSVKVLQVSMSEVHAVECESGVGRHRGQETAAMRRAAY